MKPLNEFSMLAFPRAFPTSQSHSFLASPHLDPKKFSSQRPFLQRPLETALDDAEKRGSRNDTGRRPRQSCCNHQTCIKQLIILASHHFKCAENLNLIPDEAYQASSSPTLFPLPGPLPYPHLSATPSHDSKLQRSKNKVLVSELHNLNSVQLEPKLSKTTQSRPFPITICLNASPAALLPGYRKTKIQIKKKGDLPG